MMQALLYIRLREGKKKSKGNTPCSLAVLPQCHHHHSVMEGGEGNDVSDGPTQEEPVYSKESAKKEKTDK